MSTHELPFRFIRRALETVYGDNVDQVAYNDVLRSAAERGLIDDVDRWFQYRVARNKTSHIYDARTAEDLYASARPILTDAREFLVRLRDRIAFWTSRTRAAPVRASFAALEHLTNMYPHVKCSRCSFIASTESSEASN